MAHIDPSQFWVPGYGPPPAKPKAPKKPKRARRAKGHIVHRAKVSHPTHVRPPRHVVWRHETIQW